MREEGIYCPIPSRLEVTLSLIHISWQAPAFVFLAATSGALLFYRSELLAGYLPLAANIVIVVAFTVWALATIGCAMRQRLRTMD